jgi:hypothetical protein
MALRGDEDPCAAAPGTADLAALAALRADYSHLQVDAEQWGFTRVWVARDAGGHPWLLASDDLARFRRALDMPG